MKRNLILAVCAIGVVAGASSYFGRSKSPSVLAVEPAAQPADNQTNDQPQPVATVLPAPAPAVAVADEADKPATTNPASASGPALPVASGTRWLDSSLVNQTVETLVSPLASHAQRQTAWKQLRETGRLDAAISELEKRLPTDPRSAEYPAALGQAYLQKCATIQDMREQGVLALQADKLFDSALSLDPANWEARFTKAVAMSYWPASMNKGEEVIQHFQALVEQQETQAPQPHFADSYAWLGDQYQKAGHSDDARAIWARGATLFPNDEKLNKKLAAARQQ